MKILILIWFLIPLTLSAQNAKKDIYILVKETDYLTNKTASTSEDLQFIPINNNYVNKIRLVDKNYPKINLFAFNIFFPYKPNNSDEKSILNKVDYTGNSNALFFFANLSVIIENEKLEIKELSKKDLTKLECISLEQLKNYAVKEIQSMQENTNKSVYNSINFRVISEQKGNYLLYNKPVVVDCFLIAPYTTYYPIENNSFVINTKSSISFTKEEFEDKAEKLKKTLNATEVDKFFQVHSNKIFKSGMTTFSDFIVDNFWINHIDSYFDTEKTSSINYDKFDFINYLGIINSQFHNSNYTFKAVEINNLKLNEALNKISKYIPMLREE